MNNKFKFVLLALVLISGMAHAQHIEEFSYPKDSVKQKNAQEYDSLYNELSQLKSQVKNLEREKNWQEVWKRKKYWKIGYGNPSYERTDDVKMNWEREMAVFIQRGKTGYFHSKPLGGMVKIGMDYGFMDINYAKLKLKDADSFSIEDGIDLSMHKIDYSIFAGPTVSVNPWKHLIVSAYFHARPTASGIIENDSFSYGFGFAMTAGAAISYKTVSIGIEGVWSSFKYKLASFDDEEPDYDYDYDYEEDSSKSIFTTDEFKLKQKGPRFYIAFRF